MSQKHEVMVLAIAALDRAWGYSSKGVLLFPPAALADFLEREEYGTFALAIDTIGFEHYRRAFHNAHWLVIEPDSSKHSTLKRKKGQASITPVLNVPDALSRAEILYYNNMVNGVAFVGGRDELIEASQYADEIHELKSVRQFDGVDVSLFPGLASFRLKRDITRVTSTWHNAYDSEQSFLHDTYKRIDELGKDEGEPIYVSALGERGLCLVRTATGEERLVLDKVVRYRANRQTANMTVECIGARPHIYRFDDQIARDRAIVELDSLISRLE